MSATLKPALLRLSSLPIPTPHRPPFAAAAATPPSDSDSDSDSTVSSLSSPAAARSLRSTPQLERWSRARALRSGHALPRRSDRKDPPLPSSPSPSPFPAMDDAERRDAGETTDDDSVFPMEGKVIYMVSDGTGWTAEHSVNASLGQFEHCLADRRCTVSSHLFSGIDDVSRLIEIIRQAAKENALFLYTLADPSLAEAAKKACRLWGVPFADVLGPTVEAIAAHLGVAPLGIPRGAPGRNVALSEDYFRRIEAIDFTIKQDDGALPQNLSRADIVLLGVSRTGKTPLSIYLAQKGYKVANVPIVMGLDLPKTVFQIEQGKIFALTINPVVLHTIRETRARTLGFNVYMTGNYSDMDHVKKELEFAGKIFSKNPVWPVIEVTGKAIEETAAVIVRIQNDRLRKHTMPRISRRY